jgi:uncharacterized membrane protein YqjE
MSAGASRNSDQFAPTNESQPGIGASIGELLRDLQEMVRGEVALARAEIRDDVDAIKSGVMAMAVAALLGVTALIFLMLALTWFLDNWLEQWLAALAVGAGLLIIAAVMGMSAKKRLSAASLRPDQTVESMKENAQWVKTQMS